MTSYHNSGAGPPVDFPEVLKSLLEYRLPWIGTLKGRTNHLHHTPLCSPDGEKEGVNFILISVWVPDICEFPSILKMAGAMKHSRQFNSNKVQEHVEWDRSWRRCKKRGGGRLQSAGCGPLLIDLNSQTCYVLWEQFRYSLFYSLVSFPEKHYLKVL